MALTAIGTTSFTQSGPPRWSIDADGLDTVNIAYRGRYDLLAAFLATYAKNAACPLDGNLFLDNISNDEHRQLPTVDLRYKGFRGGTLPPDKESASYSVQQARFTSFEYSDDDGMWVNITYTAPTAGKVKWGTSAVDIATVGAATPADAVVIWFTARASGSWIGYLPTDEASALSWFAQKVATIGDSDEIVSGQYYRGNQTKQNLLFSSEF